MSNPPSKVPEGPLLTTNKLSFTNVVIVSIVVVVPRTFKLPEIVALPETFNEPVVRFVVSKLVVVLFVADKLTTFAVVIAVVSKLLVLD